MKKHLYLLLPLLTPTPSMAMWSWIFGKNEPTNTTKKIVTSTIIASTLMISHSSYDKKRSLRLHQAVEQNNTTNALQLINNPQVDINAKVDYGTDSFDRAYTPLIRCCKTGDDALKIAQALLKHQHINVNLQDENGYTPLDIIIYWIKLNKENYKYVQLWNLLVEQGAVLKQCTTDYQNLNLNDFKEPHRTYIDLIKQNPPKNLSSKKHHTPTQTHPNTHL